MATKSELKEFKKNQYEGVSSSKLEARIRGKLNALDGTGVGNLERRFKTLSSGAAKRAGQQGEQHERVRRQQLVSLLNRADRASSRLTKGLTNDKGSGVKVEPTKKVIPEVKKEKGPSFKEAFAAARKKFIAGGGKASDYTFSWGGKKFHILRGDDKGGSLAEKKKNLLEAIKSGKKVRGS